jgi:hypothetical protein
MTDARQFLTEIATILRSKGREVTVTESEENFGTFVWLSSTAPHWYDNSISLSAAKSTRTGRWSLGEMKIHLSGKTLTRTTRSEIRIAADVFA